MDSHQSSMYPNFGQGQQHQPQYQQQPQQKTQQPHVQQIGLLQPQFVVQPQFQQLQQQFQQPQQQQFVVQQPQFIPQQVQEPQIPVRELTFHTPVQHNRTPCKTVESDTIVHFSTGPCYNQRILAALGVFYVFLFGFLAWVSGNFAIVLFSLIGLFLVGLAFSIFGESRLTIDSHAKTLQVQVKRFCRFREQETIHLGNIKDVFVEMIQWNLNSHVVVETTDGVKHYCPKRTLGANTFSNQLLVTELREHLTQITRQTV